MGNGSVNTLKLAICFQFQVQPLSSINFDDYITLHNLNMPLTYIVTLYHKIMKLRTRDVVIVSLYTDDIYPAHMHKG